MSFFDQAGTALITGASSGIGEAYARALAAQGWSTILVARRQERLRELSVRLPRAQALVADLSTMEGLAAVEKRLTELPDLRLLVNNAGFGTRTSLLESDVAVQQQMLDLHVRATYRLSQAALAGLAANQGALVNVSSIAGLVPSASNVNYCASKAYINFFSRALQLELSDRVRVQALCPGLTTTEFHQAPHFREFRRERVPRFLWMTPAQVVTESMRAVESRKGPVVVAGRLNRVIVALVTNPVGESLLRTARRLRGI